MNKDNPNLIECGDHSFAPWSIVCTHLMYGQSRTWQSLDSDNPEVDHDWLCPECMEQFIAEADNDQEHDLTNLRPVCIHCVRYLRRKFDRTYHA